jgi:hypothetical protein
MKTRPDESPPPRTTRSSSGGIRKHYDDASIQKRYDERCNKQHQGQKTPPRVVCKTEERPVCDTAENPPVCKTEEEPVCKPERGRIRLFFKNKEPPVCEAENPPICETETSPVRKIEKPPTRIVLKRPPARKTKKAPTRTAPKAEMSWEKKEGMWFKRGQAKDHLTLLPTEETSRYLEDKQGELRTIFNNRYHQKAQRRPPVGRRHPKILRAQKEGTCTKELEEYYQELPPHINIPRAGIPLKRPIFPKATFLTDTHLEFELFKEIFNSEQVRQLVRQQLLRS